MCSFNSHKFFKISVVVFHFADTKNWTQAVCPK